MKNFVILIALFASACGVKGDPKPPLTPAALGHGQPSFKRATKALATPPPVDAEPAAKTFDKTEQE